MRTMMTDEFKVGDTIVAIGSTILQTIVGVDRYRYKVVDNCQVPFYPWVNKEIASRHYVKVGGNGDD